MDLDCQAGRQKKKKRSREDLDPAVRLDRDPHVESLVQTMIMSKEGKGSQGQKKKMRVEARVNKTRLLPKTETVDSVTLVTPSSSNATGDCVICRHPAVPVTLQRNELDTFVSFVQQFQFQHKFNNVLFRNRLGKYQDDDDDLRRSCAGCAESVKIIWHLSTAIESMKLQVRNTISSLVEKVKAVDDDGWTQNPETAGATSHCHVTQPPEDTVVKNKPESESMCQMGLIGEDAIEVEVKTESDAEDDGAGVVTFVNSPAFDSSELDLDDIEITPENPESNLVSEEVEERTVTSMLEEALNGEFHTHRRHNNDNEERPDKSNLNFAQLESDNFNDGDDDFELDSDSAALSESDSRIITTKMTTRKKVKPMSTKKKIRIPCPHCDRSSTSNFDLKAHIRRMHRDKISEAEVKESKCSACGKYFRSAVMRIAHEIQMCRVPYDEDQVKQQLEGTKTRLQKCSFSGCELIFGMPSDLARHIRTHTGELSFPCRYCDKSFTQGSTRKLHELSICQRDPSFVAMMAKRRAECRQKKKPNTLPCPHQDCGKKFMNQTRLDFHLQRYHSHSGGTINGTEETNLMCDICGKTFTCHTSLIMHTKRVHERDEATFPCLLRVTPRCQERFTSREERIQHMAVAHGRRYKKKKKALASN